MRTSTVILFCGLALVGLFACSGRSPRSQRSFSDVSTMVKGRTAAEVAHLLGEPDSRRPVFDGDERWLWWNYTFLDGRDVPPELRGKVVHLDIVVVNPERGGSKRPPYSEWRIDDALGIRYRLPGAEP